MTSSLVWLKKSLGLCCFGFSFQLLSSSCTFWLCLLFYFPPFMIVTMMSLLINALLWNVDGSLSDAETVRLRCLSSKETLALSKVFSHGNENSYPLVISIRYSNTLLTLTILTMMPEFVRDQVWPSMTWHWLQLSLGPGVVPLKVRSLTQESIIKTTA